MIFFVFLRKNVKIWLALAETKEGLPTACRPFVMEDVKANNILNTTRVNFGNIPQPGFRLTGGINLYDFGMGDGSFRCSQNIFYRLYADNSGCIASRQSELRFFNVIFFDNTKKCL